MAMQRCKCSLRFRHLVFFKSFSFVYCVLSSLVCRLSKCRIISTSAVFCQTEKEAMRKQKKYIIGWIGWLWHKICISYLKKITYLISITKKLSEYRLQYLNHSPYSMASLFSAIGWSIAAPWRCQIRPKKVICYNLHNLHSIKCKKGTLKARI